MIIGMVSRNGKFKRFFVKLIISEGVEHWAIIFNIVILFIVFIGVLYEGSQTRNSTINKSIILYDSTVVVNLDMNK